MGGREGVVGNVPYKENFPTSFQQLTNSFSTAMALHPFVKVAMTRTVADARREGMRVTITSQFRSVEKQALLRRRFEQGLSKFPAARPGLSMHNYGFAFDAVVTAGGTQKDLGRIAARHQLIWAGPADSVHFDPFGFKLWNQILRFVGLL